MYDIYRVVCWENQNQIFADIYPAGESRPENSLTHDSIFMMRKKITPEAQRIESGILLMDLGNGNIILKYEKVYNRRMQIYQNNIRKKTDPIITHTFNKMKQTGKNRTFEISFTNMCMLYDLQAPKDNKSVCTYSTYQEVTNLEKIRLEKAHKLKQIKIDYYARDKYASNPHLKLALKQAMYRGG